MLNVFFFLIFLFPSEYHKDKCGDDTKTSTVKSTFDLDKLDKKLR